MKREFTLQLQKKLLMYGVISALSFVYLMLCDEVGISAVIFAMLQTVMLCFLLEEKRKLLWMIPVGILCFNSFLSANIIWRIPNMAVIGLLYALMFTKIDINDENGNFLKEMGGRIAMAVGDCNVPFKWTAEMCGGKKLAKRLLIAAVISICSVLVLCVVLSSADMVFLYGCESLMSAISPVTIGENLKKCVIGMIWGLFFFGILYNSYFDLDINRKGRVRHGDILIVLSVLISVLVVYTVFVFIQFRYLFSGSELPYGLNVTEYARKGFFELLALTGVNITAILAVTKITGHVTGRLFCLIKALDMYLCSVTVVLLISSFYRMWLYNETDGLTRLRFLVFGFLIFEFIGLCVTFFYIVKPRFNIILVYGAIALGYYLVLNIVPMDMIVAKNQVDRYLKGERNEIDYVLTLSADASGEVLRAYEKGENDTVTVRCGKWLKRTKEYSNDWRGFDLSTYRAEKFFDRIDK